LAACPDTGKFSKSLYLTVTPAFTSLFINDDTAPSFPGIAFAEIITVSPVLT